MQRTEDNSDRTLIIIKPDAIKKGLVGRILSRFEDKGFKIYKLEMIRLSVEKAEKFYSVHTKKSFFEKLISFMTSGPIVIAVIDGKNALSVTRDMIGPTDPSNASKGTIRGDFATNERENAIHASDSPKSFIQEYKVLFNSDYKE